MSNLLLVSLIIFGFCVFVAWYAKKHQHTLSGDGLSMEERNGHDGGYLWGLNASDSKTNEDSMSGDSMTMTLPHSQHQQPTDLLAITPDHIGRLGLTNSKMQMRAPMNRAPKVPKGHPGSRRHRKQNQKQRGRKGMSVPQESGSESESDDSGDMALQRERFYASQTLSKKLADTLGDISDAAISTAKTLKGKMRLGGQEKCVVVPMSHPNIKQRKRVKPSPFMRVGDEEEEESEGFDLETETESEESSEMRSDEFREDEATKVRMNVHGRRIKQPMALPTFDEDEEEDTRRKKKKKRKHKKRKKERKGAVELRHNNDGMMGFDTDELEEDEEDEMGGGAQMRLNAEDVAETMQELEMELLQSKGKDNETKQALSVEDLSFLEMSANANEAQNGNGNGNVEDVMDGRDDMELVDAAPAMAEQAIVLGNGTDANHTSQNEHNVQT